MTSYGHTETSHNSEYPATLRFAQIGSLLSPTSGTRKTLGEMQPNGFSLLLSFISCEELAVEKL